MSEVAVQQCRSTSRRLKSPDCTHREDSNGLLNCRQKMIEHSEKDPKNHFRKIHDVVLEVNPGEMQLNADHCEVQSKNSNFCDKF